MKRVMGMTPQIISFKTIGDITLQLHRFEPDRSRFPGLRPAVVFWFGGGWMSGEASRFYPQCETLAARGIDAFSAEYRIGGKHGTTPFESVEDGIDAVRFIRREAPRWRIDPDRIAGGGGSAGGHVALCAALFGDRREPGGRAPLDALLLFNPVVDTTAQGYAGGVPRFGGRERELSPVHHLRPSLPPTLVQHGTADDVVPFENAERFARRMDELGNRCELVPYEARGHGFFDAQHANCRPGDDEAAMRRMEAFLDSLGYFDESGG